MKLETSFFSDKIIKKMRRCENGDTLTVIYLKLLLSTLATEGRITYEHLEDSLSSEIALQLDEDENDVEELLNILLKYQQLTEVAKDEYLLTAVSSMVGSEGASAARMRAKRQRDSVSQGDGRVSQSDSNCDAEKNERRLIENKITANATAAIGGGREEGKNSSGQKSLAPSPASEGGDGDNDFILVDRYSGDGYDEPAELPF